MRGMERERVRLAGASFLTLAFRREYDYDGLREYLQVLDGFSDEADAVHEVERLAEQHLAAALAEPGHGRYQWRHDVSSNNKRFKANHDSALVQCVYRRSFEVLNDSGYDSKQFQFEVLRMDPRAAFVPDLVRYFDAEAEWVQYFISKGKE